MTQDITFSSLFLKVIVEMLIWLDNPTVEAGPLKALLKSFAGQNSHKHVHSDGELLLSVSIMFFLLFQQSTVYPVVVVLHFSCNSKV